MHPPENFEWDPARRRIHGHLVKKIGAENSNRLELFVLLQRTAHLSRLLDIQMGDDIELSGPRWRLLLMLLLEEQMGNTSGLTPTVISQTQHVSKNTISVLLRGLEAQGLIQRSLDPDDLRTFHIQLTPAGRDYLEQNVPERMNNLKNMLSGLDQSEHEQLAGLLQKLMRSLIEQLRSNCRKPGKSAVSPAKTELKEEAAAS